MPDDLTFAKINGFETRKHVSIAFQCTITLGHFVCSQGRCIRL